MEIKDNQILTGTIWKELLKFFFPTLLGTFFQQFYNTADAIIVSRALGKEALAAVGSTSPIINIVVFFFNGVSIGAGVVIGQYFGAKELEKLHDAVETTIAMTFVFGIIFTALGVAGTPFMLRFMATPDDVMGPADTYLKIYFAGVMGLLVYNMGSGILRAVGDTQRPLMFLVLSSLLNIVLDLLFVIVFRLGIAGAAYATIISQFISAILVMALLTATRDIYYFSWKDMHIDPGIFRRILEIGLPAGFQSMITSFSNVFVQSYINSFGSSSMAGWSCYNKIDQYIFLPIQSMAHSSTAFVSQNIGAGKVDRANKGSVAALAMSVSLTVLIGIVIIVVAPQAVGLFTTDESVIEFGTLFLRTNVFFMNFNAVNHVLAGALRGRGNSKAPMICMLANFVVVRQIYLFIISHTINTPGTIGFGYPVGWVCCSISEVLYFYFAYIRGKRLNRREENV